MKVAAIVLNWNRPEETAACCRSLAGQTHSNLNIWVVDNGSTQNTAEELALACPQTNIVRLDTNLGFAGGVNAGIHAAQTKESFDFAWLVNNDAICEPEALQTMLERALDDERIAATGCFMIEGGSNKALRRVDAGRRLRPPLYIPSEVKPNDQPDYLCGACMLIRQTALSDIGLLDDGFFFFFEDADWCFRARSAGWKLAVSEQVLLKHLASATISTMPRLRASHYRAGLVRFLRKHTRHPFAAAALVTAYRLLAALLTGKFAVVRGTLDGWQQGWKMTLCRRSQSHNKNCRRHQALD